MRSPEFFRQLKADFSASMAVMLDVDVTIDTSEISPEAAGMTIEKVAGLSRRPPP
ncbi:MULTISPECIES: hypothetical protein [unclassified Beijerinckia]|uniref:hypothetical protein n=1 Tax=unclassified Beijerinckia TaxID=2638183 RepID=UPI00147AD8A2|nr:MULTISPECIES: hypothetical protein [unclassified Beijerinckia]MDH7794804.1 hypothetical protein [Beijerinckia sp. GAS462]